MPETSPARLTVDRGIEQILVVEDDDSIRDLVVRQIFQLGYRVIEAADGAAGLEIIRERADIDLLFTDITMPGGMSGYDLAEAAERLRPDLRILFTSGYSEDSAGRGGQQFRKNDLLKKPYRRQELSRRLRKAFDLDMTRWLYLPLVAEPG